MSLVKQVDMKGCDTLVRCKKCGKKQWLKFVNGLKNGWSKCCGETMPIVKCTANIGEATRQAIQEQVGSQ